MPLYTADAQTLMVNIVDRGADPTGMKDSTTAIQNAANSASGLTLYIPNGTFLITSTISLSAGTHVQFAGRNAVIKYTGSGDAFKASEIKGLVIDGNGTLDISGAGTSAIGIHFYGVWFAAIKDLKIIQGPASSVGIYIETSATGGDHYGSYCINIENLDATVGNGAAAIQTTQTTGDTGVARVTHLQIINGWSKNKTNGINLNQASTVWIDGFAVDTGTNGYYIGNCDNVIIRAGELGPVTNYAIEFVTSSDLEGIILLAPSYAGLSGTNGYMDTSYYQPTVYDRSSVYLKASASVNNYLFSLQSLYNYSQSLVLAAQGGGSLINLLTWGDAAGMTLAGGTGHVNVADNMVVYKNGSTAQLFVKSSDGSQQLYMYHTGTGGFGQIESTTGFVLASDNGSAAITGTVNPQLKVQHSGGSYNSINLYHDDSNGSITTSAGNLSITPASGSSVGINNSSPKSTLDVSGSQGINRTTVADTAYTIVATDYLVAYTSLTTGRTVTLPTAVSIGTRVYIIKDETGSASTRNITIATTSSQTIDGASTKVINTNYGSARVYSNGSNWFTF